MARFLAWSVIALAALTTGPLARALEVGEAVGPIEMTSLDGDRVTIAPTRNGRRWS